MEKKYKIEVDCPACANKMEDAAKKTNGVAHAAVSFMTQKLIVGFDEGADSAAVMREVRKNCKKATADCEIFL
jgi:cation transport ATPase